LIVYPGVHHNFDVALLTPGVRYRGIWLEYNEPAAKDQADDAVGPGKWVFSAVASAPRAPPGAELGSKRLARSGSACITSDDPLPPMARGPSTPRPTMQDRPDEHKRALPSVGL